MSEKITTLVFICSLFTWMLVIFHLFYKIRLILSLRMSSPHIIEIWLKLLIKRLIFLYNTFNSGGNWWYVFCSPSFWFYSVCFFCVLASYSGWWQFQASLPRNGNDQRVRQLSFRKEALLQNYLYILLPAIDILDLLQKEIINLGFVFVVFFINQLVILEL